jgi:hypothetical protein
VGARVVAAGMAVCAGRWMCALNLAAEVVGFRLIFYLFIDIVYKVGMPLFRANYSTADEAMVAYTREQEEARAADDKRIKSLQQVYSNMKFFDMLQLISSRYNDLVFDERQAATSNNNTGVSDFVKNPNTLPKRIIEILNTYRVKTFDVEDKGTLFVGTFRTMITRAGWWSEVTIGKFVNITPNLTVEYREGSDIMKFPCAKVELFPIKVKEIGGTYKTPVIELAEQINIVMTHVCMNLMSRGYI